MPMPRMMPATMVSSSARISMFCAAASTRLVNSIPSPVSVITPTTMPAQAQASATVTVLRAPNARPSMTDQAAILENILDARQVGARQALEAGALGLEVHGHEHGQVVQDRRDQGGERDME